MLTACGIIVAALAAGCGSGPGSGLTAHQVNIQPPWVTSLGPGVTVTDSSGATPGDGSPAGVVLTVVKDMQTGNYSASCDTFPPPEQPACKSEFDSATAAELRHVIPTFKNFTPTYTAIKGDQALIGNIGTDCEPYAKPECVTNTDAAAIFDSGQPFANLWKGATAPHPIDKNAYALNAMVRKNGIWYAYSSG